MSTATVNNITPVSRGILHPVYKMTTATVKNITPLSRGILPPVSRHCLSGECSKRLAFKEDCSITALSMQFMEQLKLESEAKRNTAATKHVLELVKAKSFKLEPLTEQATCSSKNVVELVKWKLVKLEPKVKESNNCEVLNNHFKCPKCGCVFSDAKALKQHRRLHRL